ncbi:MAG: SRPBCC family protein [Candidatus Binataceae bacterium]
MTVRNFTREMVIARPLDQTFAFFADPRNLETLTPAFLRFRFLREPPRQLAAGLILEYRIRLYGVPVRWQTLIESFDPPHRFIDMQQRGPYAHWRHTHSFEVVDQTVTRVRDAVEFAMPLGPLGDLAY